MHRHNYRLLAVFLTSMMLLHASFAQTSVTASQRRPKRPAVLRALIGGVWRVDHTFVATIQVQNILTNAPIDFTPVLFMADGTEYDLPSMTLPAAGFVEVNVNDALRTAPADVAAHLSSYGSVAVRYAHGWNAIDATIQNLDTVRSLIFRQCLADSVLVNAQTVADQALEGLWWKRDAKTDGFVGLSNTTDRPVQMHMQPRAASGGNGATRVIELGPHASTIVTLSDLVVHGPAGRDIQGGLSVHFHGIVTDVNIIGGMENADQGFSAPMYFRVAGLQADPGPRQLAAVGLMVGKPDPMMNFPTDVRFTPYIILHNAQSTPLPVQPSIEYFVEMKEQTLTLPVVRLLPWQTVRLDFNAIMATQGIKDYDGTVHVAFAYTGIPNVLLAATGSVDDSGTYVFDVPVRGVASAVSKTLYFSDINGFDTMFTVWNPTGDAQDAVLTFHTKTGSYKLPLHLDGHGSAMFTLSDIAMMNTPDVDGRRLSGDLFGKAEITSANGHGAKFTLAVDSGAYNVQTATCGGGCDCGVYVVGVEVYDDPFAVFFADTHQLTATADWSDSSQTNITTDYAWSTDSGNIGVGINTGNTSGDAVGTATITFYEDFGNARWPDGCWQYDYCDDKNIQEAQSPGTVTGYVQISSTTLGGNASATLYVTSQSPQCGTATVQVFVNRGGLSANPTVTVTLSKYSGTANPTINGSASPQSNSVTIGTGNSTGNIPFNVCAGSTAGSAVLQAVITAVSPSTEFPPKDPSPATNAQLQLTITN
jgi:hypothetical protein